MTRKKNSKLVLGCVQFGTPYGIRNKKKIKPTRSEIFKIMEYAKSKQINELDNSEDYNFKIANIYKKQFTYSTKIKTLNLNCNMKYYCIYIHDGDKFINNQNQNLYKYLHDLKKKKIIKKIGISIYNVNNIKKIIEKYKFDIIQAPYSIFDRRIEKYFKILKKNKIKVYARSVFLQGLLLTPSKDLDIYFKKWMLNFKLIDKFVEKKKISRLELCLNLVFNSKYIDKVVVGVQSLSQLKSIINFRIKKKILIPKFIKHYDKKLIYPFNWKVKNINKI